MVLCVSRNRLLLASTALFSVLAGSYVLAADTVISSGSTVGQQNISDGDTLTIENSATVVDTLAGVIDAANGTSVTIINEGTITANTSVTPQSAIDTQGSTLSLINKGSISGAENGVDTTTLKSLTNTAMINGAQYGILVAGDTGSLVNSGTISGSAMDGFFGIGTLSSLTNTGLITGADSGLSAVIASSIVNSGTISGGIAGVNTDILTKLVNTGLITATATPGIGDGVYVDGNLDFLDNSGTISGNMSGVLSDDSIGTLNNTGLITGLSDYGVTSFNHLTELTNSGTISGGLGAIGAGSIGTIINKGLMTGNDGIYSDNTLLSLDNSGTISGTLGDGVYVDLTATSIRNTGAVTGSDSGFNIGDVTSFFNSGAITGQGVDGIYVEECGCAGSTGILGALTNTGSITGAQHSIHASKITSLNNTGTLTGGDEGVLSQTITNLQNSGAITGTSSDGIAAETLTTLFNSGTIAGGDDGIDASYIANLVNYGGITGQDEGIKARTIAMLTNFGTITGGGAADQSGIDADYGTILNYGVIQGGIGIEFDRTNSDGFNMGNASITNFGKIQSFSGASGVAIDFQLTGADTLTLGQDSILVGTVKWDGVDDTLNIAAGVSAIPTFTTLPANVNVASPFYNISGNTVIQVDTSFLSAVDDIASKTTQGITSALASRINTARFGGSRDIEGQGYGTSEDDKSTSNEGAFWTEAWTSYHQLLTAANLNTDRVVSGGAVFGGDRVADNGMLFGALAGIGVSYTRIGKLISHNVDTYSYYGGAYAHSQYGSINFDASLVGGVLSFDSRRSVANSQAQTGLEVAQANFSGLFIAPALKASTEIELSHGHFLVPILSGGYNAFFIDGYSETGSAANTSIKARAIHQVHARAELGYAMEFEFERLSDIRLTPYIGGEGQFAVQGADKVVGTLVGTTTTFNPGGSNHTTTAFAGLKFDVLFSNSTTFSGATEIKYDSDGKYGVNGSWGLKFRY